MIQKVRYGNLLLLLLLYLAATGCGTNPVSHQRRELPRALTAQEMELIDSDNLFGLNLFRAVSEAEGDTNIFISPLSVSMALGMTLNGADGETYTAMRETLELSGLTEDEINQAYRSLIDLLRNLDPKVVFEIANSIWYRNTFDISPTFVDVNRVYFDAVVSALDFSDPGAADIINAWVEEKTHGLIDSIVDPPIDPSVVMYLINAIYFKGYWTYQFDPDDTRDGDFTLIDGSTKQVPMMTLSNVSLPYYRGDNFQAIDLAYGDSCYSMTILMPDPGQNLDSFIAGLDQSTWDALLANISHSRLDLFQMPKFKLEYKIKLNDVLKALGMQNAFDPGGADFSRMRAVPAPGLYISRVMHKTFIEVDEEGTEAAAVTSVEIREISAGAQMQVNRPFIYAIRERYSGSILFIGKMMDPAA